MPIARILAVYFVQQRVNHLDFIIIPANRRQLTRLVKMLFQGMAAMNQQRGVPAVVHNHIQCLSTGKTHRLIGTPPVLLQRFPLPGIDGHTRRRNGRRGMVLGRKNVAARPAHFRTQRPQRFYKYRRLDGHMKGPHDPGTLERLLRRIALTHRHQAGHLLLRHFNLFTAPFGKAQIRHFKCRRFIGVRNNHVGCCHR
ncbi:MAG: hypothetical protein BWX80_04068 [Candidatus Hydrogenedentes bacterium ADurb.Bin101]|nr:MAG: hypothetical protein BWX80_04068 [Candidatus Hydrogenedentes bacterium ADurb.Bin101]